MTRDEMQAVVNRTTFYREADVKRVVRRLLKQLGAFHFMPPANTFGRAGIADIICVWDGRAVAIETKFGKNKPTANQIKFGRDWSDAGGFFAVVNENNIVDMLQLALRYVGGEDVSRFNA